MNRHRIILALVVASAVLALGSLVPGCKGGRGPRSIVLGRDTCARCRMILSRPGYGGEILDANGRISTYDDVGCLLQALNATPTETPAAWVEDHGGSTFVPLLKASFVKGSSEKTPMNHGILAFKDPAAAKAFAQTNGGSIVALEQLLRDPDLQAAAPALAASAEPFTEGESSLGRAVYLRECSACHGELGDGKSVAAELVNPKPRDFTKRNFRFHSTESGTPPRAADIVGTIERGIPGTAMPSFSFLSPEERRQAGAYVIHLANLLGKPEGTPIVVPPEPPPPTPATIAHGHDVFLKNGCVACHGPEGKGDGPQSATLKTVEGNPIRPRDFTVGVYKGGGTRRDLFLRVSTGIDGTPMPSFVDGIPPEDRWALVDFVLSLKKPAAPLPFPADAIAAGRELVNRRHCNACHVIDEGKGGSAGPDLRVSGQKLDPAFVKRFLADPRTYGKVYPWRVSRMPDLKLSPEEIDVASKYLAAMGKRPLTSPPLPDAKAFSQANLSAGQLVFTLRCAQCHALGELVKTPLASQQGPDLIRVSGRVDFDWMKRWVTDPRKIDPKTKMAVPGITPNEVESVREFVFKASMDNSERRPTGGGG